MNENHKIKLESISETQLEELQENGNHWGFAGIGDWADEEGIVVIDEEISDEQQRYNFASSLKLNKISYLEYKNAWEELLTSRPKIAEYKISIGACYPVHIMSNGYKNNNVQKVAQETLENYLDKNEKLNYIPWFSLYFIVLTRRMDKANSSETIFQKGADDFNNTNIKLDLLNEKCVYIGQTKSDRFKNGHKAFTKLNNPRYEGYEKRIYMASISVRFENSETFIPLEFIPNNDYVKDIRDYIESALIYYIDTTHEMNSEWKNNYKTKNYKILTLPQIHSSEGLKIATELLTDELYAQTDIFNNLIDLQSFKKKLGLE